MNFLENTKKCSVKKYNSKHIDFEYVVNSIFEGVFTVDTDYNITTFNLHSRHV